MTINSNSIKRKRYMAKRRTQADRYSRLALAAITGMLLSMASVSEVYASTQSTNSQTALLDAWANTTSQPVLQISGGTSFSDAYVDQGGQSQNESDTFSAQLEMDNGGYDELLKDFASGSSGGASTLFIQSDDTYYYQQGQSWEQGGKISSNTLEEESPLLQNLSSLTASPAANGGVQYKGSMTANQILALIDDYLMTGQSNSPYDNLADHIVNDSKSLVTVTTSSLNGKPVVDEVQMNLAVTLSLADTISVHGISGDTSKVQPEQINMTYDFNNTFNQQTFPSPITGQTPAEQLASQNGTSSGSTGTSTSTGSTTSKPASHLSKFEVNRAFQNAFGRNAYSNELAKWTAVDNLTYASLMQCPLAIFLVKEK